MSCCVNFCKNRSDRGNREGLRFYRFPSDPKQEVLWYKAARRWDLLKLGPGTGKHRKICSAHFITGKFSRNPTHPDYVPSIFPFNSEREYSRVTQRLQRFVRQGQRAKAAGTPFIPLFGPVQQPGKLQPQAPGRPQPQAPGRPQPQANGCPQPQASGLPQPQAPGCPQPQASGLPQPQAPGCPQPQASGRPQPQAIGLPQPLATGRPQNADGSRTVVLLIYNPPEGSTEQAVRMDYEIKVEDQENHTLRNRFGDHTYSKSLHSARVEPLLVKTETVECNKTQQIQEEHQQEDPQEDLQQEDPQQEDPGQSQEPQKLCQHQETDNEQKRMQTTGNKKRCERDHTYQNKQNAPPKETEKSKAAQSSSDSQNKQKQAQNSGENPKPLLCPICGHYSWSIARFVYHVKKHGDELYRCKVCDKKFRWKFLLNMHTSIHTGETPFSCLYCDKRYRLKKSLQVHMRLHTNGFDCTYCGRQFRTEDFLEKHLLRHEAQEERERERAEREREQAEKAKSAGPGLQQNAQSDASQHSQLKELSDQGVEHCDFTVKYSGPQCLCSECGKTFSTKGNLDKHMRVIHTQEKPFSCSLCGLKFRRKKSFSIHMMHHTGEKPFRCTVCQKGFCQKENLKGHMLTHTRTKLFICEICGANFHHRTALNSHATVHTKERPFSCIMCPKNYKNVIQLHQHMRTTHGAGDHHCSFCPKRFMTESGLHKHVARKHITPQNCGDKMADMETERAADSISQS